MKFFVKALMCFILLCSLNVQAEVLQAGVAVNEVPEDFFGSWRVLGKLDVTNSYKTFKPQAMDFWNLIKKEDVITLENPHTGISADIFVDAVEGNLVKFIRKSQDGNKLLVDTVSLRLDKNSFSGINTLELKSFSLIDGHLMKTETATYMIKGEKISK